ncbi:MAG TPA: Ku protein [Steroidobacteraceae bacterium]|nr:Ku protein [Steroidobacteraceae bacterium]
MSKRKKAKKSKAAAATKRRKSGQGTRKRAEGRHRRAIWKGAVSFGLVYIPVHLHSAARDSALDLDLLDSRDFSPVGYQRYNKRTGKVVDWGDIVKGYEYQKGQYVALTDEDFRRANVEASQTIDIVSFAERADIPPEYFETPYYLEPMEGGEKTYALLREAMRDGSKVAIGSFVIRGRQHFCAIVVRDRALMLNTLRFAEELVPAEGLELPPADARSVKVSRQEVAMARRLVEEMTGDWKPEQFKDSYRRDLMRRINEKIRKRQTHELTPATEPEEERPTAEVIDLMAVLKRSLEKSGGARGRRKAA